MAEIRFSATVYKVQTLSTDYGIRVTLDLPEDAIPQMAMLAECKKNGIYLTFSATVDGEDITRPVDKNRRNINHHERN